MFSYLPGKFFGKPPLVRQKEQDKSLCLSFFTEQNKKLIKKLLLARRQVFSLKFRQNKTKKNGRRIETAGQFLGQLDVNVVKRKFGGGKRKEKQFVRHGAGIGIIIEYERQSFFPPLKKRFQKQPFVSAEKPFFKPYFG